VNWVYAVFTSEAFDCVPPQIFVPVLKLDPVGCVQAAPVQGTAELVNPVSAKSTISELLAFPTLTVFVVVRVAPLLRPISFSTVVVPAIERASLGPMSRPNVEADLQIPYGQEAAPVFTNTLAFAEADVGADAVRAQSVSAPTA